jgi:GNAT superfamily N-acetyltransferase
MMIRDAAPEDATAACNVLRRSIIELCVADHRDDPTILSQWLASKTSENLRLWIARPDNNIMVAVEGETILAVGGVTNAGEVNLNYVSPEARFRGVSKTLLKALEARAVERGAHRCTLTSTGTARRFYRAAGYVEDAASIGKFGAMSHPMSKDLRAQRR